MTAAGAADSVSSAGSEQAAGRGTDAEHVEVVAGDDVRLDELLLAVDDDRLARGPVRECSPKWTGRCRAGARTADTTRWPGVPPASGG